MEIDSSDRMNVVLKLIIATFLRIPSPNKICNSYSIIHLWLELDPPVQLGVQKQA